jgi:hypothetical protein
MADRAYQFPTSSALIVFPKPLTGSQVSFQEIPFPLSEKAKSRLSAHWLEQLRKKQSQLALQGIGATIRNDFVLDGELNASLFVNEQPVMWPGSCITLREWNLDEGHFRMVISKTSYPFIAALSDPDFTFLFSEDERSSIRPPLAICTFAITTDQMLVLTVRGKTTNVYPGRFYGQGGNPTSVEVNLQQHQLEELQEELILSPDEVIQDSLQFHGIVEDSEAFPGKPDLIGTLNISLSAQELQRWFDLRPPDQRPSDVAHIRFIHLDEESLLHFLKDETQPNDFCPPAHGGLMLIGLFLFGSAWLEKVNGEPVS